MNLFAQTSNETISLITYILTVLASNVPFLYPLKTSENQVFLTFSGGVEMEHWVNRLFSGNEFHPDLQSARKNSVSENYL